VVATVWRQRGHIDGEIRFHLGQVSFRFETRSVTFAAAGVVIRFDFDLQRFVVYLVVSVHQVNETLAGFIRNVSNSFSSIAVVLDIDVGNFRSVGVDDLGHQRGVPRFAVVHGEPGRHAHLGLLQTVPVQFDL